MTTLNSRTRMPSCASRVPEGIFHVRRCVPVVVITSPDMLLTRAEAAEVAGVDVERIRTWERRRHLDRAGLNEDGLPVYQALDVAKCKHRFQGLGRGELAA